MDYYHMKKVHDYVFSVPPGEERDKRLLEISKTDNDALYDFSMGLLSGRIQEPKTKKEEVGKMNKKEKIVTFGDFKNAYGKTGYYHQLRDLRQSDPDKYERFKERLEREKLKESNPVAYHMQYGSWR